MKNSEIFEIQLQHAIEYSLKNYDKIIEYMEKINDEISNFNDEKLFELPIIRRGMNYLRNKHAKFLKKNEINNTEAVKNLKRCSLDDTCNSNL